MTIQSGNADYPQRDLCRTVLGTTADIHDYDGLRRLPEFRRRVGGYLVRVF